MVTNHQAQCNVIKTNYAIHFYLKKKNLNQGQQNYDAGSGIVGYELRRWYKSVKKYMLKITIDNKPKCNGSMWSSKQNPFKV